MADQLLTAAMEDRMTWKPISSAPRGPAPNWCRTCGKYWADPKAICLDPIHVPAIAHRELNAKETDDEVA